MAELTPRQQQVIDYRNARFARAVAFLRQGLANQLIYNVDYEYSKDAFNNAIDSEVSEAGRSITREQWQAVRHWNADVGYLGIVHVSTIGAAKKKIEKARKKFPELDYSGYDAFFAKWEPIAADMKAVKAYIKKGRKPSENPRITPERTLENTGTCPICGQNVKIPGGKLYDHGFKIQWSQRNGNCFGVGYEPWELSPKGAQDYLTALGHELGIREVQLKNADTLESLSTPNGLVKKDHPTFERRLTIYKANVQSDIRMINSDIRTITKRIAEWEAQPLPGDLIKKD